MRQRLDSYIDRHLGSYPTVAKWVRYSAASVATVAVTQAVLLTCFVVIGLSAITSNLIAVTVGAAPSYIINRAWTFNKTGTHSMTREVVPFWSMALLGLVLSTVSVAWVDRTYDGNPVLVAGANFAAFGVLWIGRFIILDRVLFGPQATAAEQHSSRHGG